MPWDIPEQVVHLQKLLVPGVLGTYNSFEVIEFVGFQQEVAPTNFFTLLIAEPAIPIPSPNNVQFVNSKPIQLPSTQWRFGVVRSRLPVQTVIDAINHLHSTGEWKPDKHPLRVSPLRPARPQFVPSDSHERHPWNGVLKNNFFEGSHVVELCDETKAHVKFLLEEPGLLSELAVLMLPHAKFAIDGLSDRLGNIVIQLPVTVISTSMRGSPAGHITMEPVWNAKVAPRPLQVSFERYKDGTVDDFASKSVQSGATNFPLHSPGGGPRYVVWDDANEVVLGASAPTMFITSISVGMHVNGLPSATPREFKVPAPANDGTYLPERVKILEHPERTEVISQPTKDPREPWRSERVFKEGLDKLQVLKEFVQYGGRTGAHDSRALADVRWLINQHGRHGAWLWDPFLNADDVLNTLFFCHHRGADLRSLTSGQEPRDSKVPPQNQAVVLLRSVSRWAERKLTTGRLGQWLNEAQPVKTFTQRQFEALENAKGNGEGLPLEFRIRQGTGAWPFHDRFLIFPGARRGSATAWSLGTSVNSLGNQHHILQKVSDGERIRQAFLELWDELAQSENLIWKSA